MKKRVLSVLLVMTMAVSLCIPASATSVTTSGGTASTNLVGTISATQLRVTVPAQVEFQINPKADAASDPTAQVTQPDMEIVNSSNVDVYVSINQVTAQNVTLVNKLADIQNDSQKNLMFALGEKGTTKDYDTEADWLMTSSTNYSLNGTTGGKIEAAKSTGGSVTDGKMELTIFARADKGWQDNDTFTVTPTFVISLSRPDVASIVATDGE